MDTDSQGEYMGIYKPGELGRGTWRAVLPYKGRRGRGYRGNWETVVLSTEGRSGVNDLINRIKDIVRLHPSSSLFDQTPSCATHALPIDTHELPFPELGI